MQCNVRNLSKTNMLLLLEVLLLTTATVGWLSLCTTTCLLAYWGDQIQTATTTANSSKKSMESVEERMNTGSHVSQAHAVPHQAPQPNVSIVATSVNKCRMGVSGRSIGVQPPYSWINLDHIWRSLRSSVVIDTCQCGFIPANIS